MNLDQSDLAIDSLRTIIPGYANEMSCDHLHQKIARSRGDLDPAELTGATAANLLSKDRVLYLAWTAAGATGDSTSSAETWFSISF